MTSSYSKPALCPSVGGWRGLCRWMLIIQLSHSFQIGFRTTLVGKSGADAASGRADFLRARTPFLVCASAAHSRIDTGQRDEQRKASNGQWRWRREKKKTDSRCNRGVERRFFHFFSFLLLFFSAMRKLDCALGSREFHISGRPPTDCRAS